MSAAPTQAELDAAYEEELKNLNPNGAAPDEKPLSARERIALEANLAYEKHTSVETRDSIRRNVERGLSAGEAAGRVAGTMAAGVETIHNKISPVDAKGNRVKGEGYRNTPAPRIKASQGAVPRAPRQSFSRGSGWGGSPIQFGGSAIGHTTIIGNGSLNHGNAPRFNGSLFGGLSRLGGSSFGLNDQKLEMAKESKDGKSKPVHMFDGGFDSFSLPFTKKKSGGR